MSRSIEVRLQKLETLLAPEKPQRRIRLIAFPTREEGDAEIARLKAEGAGPDTLFVRLVGLEPDPGSAVPDRDDDIH
jgi:hypothetical protein